MHNVEDIISDSEDDITTFCKPFKPEAISNGLDTEGHVVKDSAVCAKDEDDETEESEEVYFHMTQMQSIHESVTGLEKENDLQKKSILLLRSLQCDSHDQIDEDNAPNPPVKKRGKRKLATGVRGGRKNQSMSSSVREVFESDKSRYFIAKQSRIDEFCARSKNNNLSRTLQHRRLEQLSGKQTLSSTDWQEILNVIRIQFPRTKLQLSSEIQTEESFECKSLWDEAGSNIMLNDEEINILYNR
ncbi:SLX4 [Candida theae]|uniref:SLX4 n=1 Tax=Candida theae TaxID=1198502 RepID=A0AAD5BE79_9ASCO|nr:SLX4 [Candida theae]KAI5957972.1 SLX4 [Candida theae]